MSRSEDFTRPEETEPTGKDLPESALSPTESDGEPRRRYRDHLPGSEEDTTIVRPAPIKRRPKETCAALVVLDGPEIGNQFPLRRTRYTIGRASDACISLRADHLISRLHSEVVMEYDADTNATRYLLRDLGSTNHTFVNGQAVESHYLENGDKIQTGDTTLRFCILDEMEARFHKTVQQRIHFDPLTSLLTKDSCDLAITSELTRCEQRHFPLAVLMMDIDFFRNVNERYGHQGGSWILSELGSLFENNLRGFDLVGRFGGEEFMAGLPEASLDDAMDVAERIRRSVEDQVFPWNGDKIRITISIGVSVFPEDGRTLKDLVAAADKALYRSKHTGRNRVTAASDLLQDDSNPTFDAGTVSRADDSAESEAA